MPRCRISSAARRTAIRRSSPPSREAVVPGWMQVMAQQQPQPPPPQQQQQWRYFGRKPVPEVVEEERVWVPPPPRYAVVEHGDAYRKAMEGLHGQQLSLAQRYGEGRDDPDYDPFLEEELEEIRRMREEEDEAAAEDDGLEEEELEEEEEESKMIAGGKEDNDRRNAADDEEEADLEEEEEEGENDMDALWKINKKIYNKDGSLRRNKSELAVLRAGAPAGGVVAIIQLPCSQYKVTTDDLLIVNKLLPTEKWSVGSRHTLRDEDVLLLTSSGLTLVGMPHVPGAEVDVLVEEITQDARVIIFKSKQRTRSQRKRGFRRQVTMLRILDIRYPAKYADHAHARRPDPAPLVNPKSKRAIIDYTAKVAAS